MRIVFAGTPMPALPSLQRFIDSPRHDVIAVLTRPDAAAGRRGRPAPSPVAQMALDAGIPVLRPDRPNSVEFVAEMTELAPDCCAVVAYGALLSADEVGALPAAEQALYRAKEAATVQGPYLALAGALLALAILCGSDLLEQLLHQTHETDKDTDATTERFWVHVSTKNYYVAWLIVLALTILQLHRAMGICEATKGNPTIARCLFALEQ